MPDIVLSPTIDHLHQEYLLVPAWKKAHDYIRRHNSYADVLELDLTNADLGATIQSIVAEISSGQPPRSTPLRLVLAPKTQAWHIKDDQWIPVDGPSTVEQKLRPLAHLSVRDQIIGTAFMMLLADIVETIQGDPRVSAIKARRNRMVSYGHRLFCDEQSGQLRFRWGNAGVYRQYFQDYQNFIARPEQIVEADFGTTDSKWAVVTADLSQFYDRVRPELLHSKVRDLRFARLGKNFLSCFESFFHWTWHGSEAKEALKYAKQTAPTSISDFDRIALPQGLVSSGFFSNVVLLDFDDFITRQFETWNTDREWQLLDYCRYVDDMRFVVRLSSEFANLKQHELEARLKTSITDMINGALNELAPGLIVNPSKCEVILGKNAGGGSIRVSSSMRRINRNASGVMDQFVGEETLELIETLLYSSEVKPLEFGQRFPGTVLAAQPDVREDTVARFAANRFRSAYRTLRPMSEATDAPLGQGGAKVEDESDDWNAGRFRLSSTLTRQSLDQKATHFASRLIERWIRDPSSVRLLRVALDLRPDVQILEVVLGLLNDYLVIKTKQKAPRRVAWYCAAELLKAGATETGLIEDQDKLPEGTDLKRYQSRLAQLAQYVITDQKSFPWYLIQQAYLFLACYGEFTDHQTISQPDSVIKPYVLFHKALKGAYSELPPTDVPRFSLLHANQSTPDQAAKAFLKRWHKEEPDEQRSWLIRILSENRQLAQEIWHRMRISMKPVWKTLFETYGILDGNPFPVTFGAEKTSGRYSLLAVARATSNPFQQEYLAVQFVRKVIPLLFHEAEVIAPNRVILESQDWNALTSNNFPIREDAFNVEISPIRPQDNRFKLPNWVSVENRWKYQLGMLLRVLLTGTPDYTLDVRQQNVRSNVVYRAYRSSWLRRRYGMFNGRTAFGPPWIPISSWMGTLLNKLLKWPGFAEVEFDFHLPDNFDADRLGELMRARIAELERLYGRASRTPLLPITVPKAFGRINIAKVDERKGSLQRMRVGVAQTVIPRNENFTAADPQLLDGTFRRKHRRHSASVLAGVQRMLEVRTTHQDSAVGIELLVLPELSIHPTDVDLLLKPFVMQNRCIVCAGLVFHPVTPSDQRLVNFAVWLIPVHKPNGGIGVDIVYQGKFHMTPHEIELGITSYRPAQWVLEIVDPQAPNQRLWAMTSSICYDATDLSLAADLRNETDLFVVPALNIDVGTYDNMAAALHYHMFQHLIVANTGEYGGSCAHAPFKDKNKRTIFHTHGNDQVAVSFFEVDFDLYRNQRTLLKAHPANHRRHF